MLLATTLMYVFSRSTQAVYAPSLSEVAQEIKDRFGVNKVILHLDEFQSSPVLARKIMTGCKLSLVTGGYGICVIPILSGISDLRHIAEPFDPSNWAGEEYDLDRFR